jgi:hypothetical protein
MPSETSSTSFAQYAGRSSGLREVTRPWVDDDFLVDPVASLVANVGLEGWPRRRVAATRDVGFDEHPGAVADHRNRLARFEERPHGRDSVLVHIGPQANVRIISIEYALGKIRPCGPRLRSTEARSRGPRVHDPPSALPLERLDKAPVTV